MMGATQKVVGALAHSWRKANNGFESASRGTKTPLQHCEFDAWAHQRHIQLRFDPPDEPTRTHMLKAFTSALAEVHA
jgi:hypothetical protein